MEFFNSQFAQQQLSGNHEILCRLLTKFIDDYQNAESDIQDMITVHNFTSAHMMLHTLKGVSGNLGMERLHDFCKRAENLARDEHLHPNDINELTTLIAETTKHVNQFINESVPENNVVNVSHHMTADPKSVLLEYITKNQFIPYEKLDILLSSLNAESGDVEALKEAIQILDYENALAIIDSL